MVSVCHMTSAHSSNDMRIYSKECVSLAKAGYQVYLVAQGESGESNGVRIIGVGADSTSRIRRMTKLAKAVYLKARDLDCDIYHIHDPELLPYALKLKKSGRRVVFDSHENHPLQLLEREYIPSPFRKAVSTVYRLYEGYVTRQLDACIIPCTFEGKNIFDKRAQRTVVVANYPLLEEFAHRLSKRLGYVCYTGTISRANGCTALVKATARANSILLLAGSFSSTEYRNSLCMMPEFSFVDFQGYVNREEVFNIYSQASVGAYTELIEGQNGKADTFGVKVFEYMAMGLPIVVSNYSYSKYILDEHNCGICAEPGDSESIADAILYLLNNPDIAQSMGENGRRAILEKLNWGCEEKKLLELYKSLQSSTLPL